MVLARGLKSMRSNWRSNWRWLSESMLGSSGTRASREWVVDELRDSLADSSLQYDSCFVRVTEVLSWVTPGETPALLLVSSQSLLRTLQNAGPWLQTSHVRRAT